MFFPVKEPCVALLTNQKNFMHASRFGIPTEQAYSGQHWVNPHAAGSRRDDPHRTSIAEDVCSSVRDSGCCQSAPQPVDRFGVSHHACPDLRLLMAPDIRHPQTGSALPSFGQVILSDHPTAVQLPDIEIRLKCRRHKFPY
jgi:hypothetical protein